MKRQGIPSQQEHNSGDPEEHFLWALQNMPMAAGTGAVTHPSILREWSAHLWAAGFRHRDYIEKLADESGSVAVSDLPEQQIWHRPPFRGPRHGYNNAARWVDKNSADPQPVHIPDIRDLTIQEQHALLYQFQDQGMIPRAPVVPAQGEVEGDDD